MMNNYCIPIIYYIPGPASFDRLLRSRQDEIESRLAELEEPLSLKIVPRTDLNRFADLLSHPQDGQLLSPEERRLLTRYSLTELELLYKLSIELKEGEGAFCSLYPEADGLREKHLINSASQLDPSVIILELAEEWFGPDEGSKGCMEFHMPQASISELSFSPSFFFRNSYKAQELDESTRKAMEEMARLMEEKLRIEKQIALLKEQLKERVHDDIPRIVIEEQLRILLPSCDMELQFYPLHKAVYILFLRHPEGIDYSHIFNYRDELRAIYALVQPNATIQQLYDRIKDVATRGSLYLNQLVCRINSSIRSQLSPELAPFFLIEGQRGGLRRVQAASGVTYKSVLDIPLTAAD